MKKKYNRIIQNRVLDLLNKSNFSAEKLSYSSGISKSCLSEIINNKKTPTSFTIAKLCAGLNISISSFYNFEELNDFLNEL